MIPGLLKRSPGPARRSKGVPGGNRPYFSGFIVKGRDDPAPTSFIIQLFQTRSFRLTGDFLSIYIDGTDTRGHHITGGIRFTPKSPDSLFDNQFRILKRM